MILVLLGGSCSGKTDLAEKCVDLGYERVITNTTRQRRIDDSENSYNFLTKEEFQQKIENNEMIEYAEYNGNLYGTSIDSITEKCVIVLEPNGYKAIKKIYGEKVVGIYLKVSDEERRKRGIFRGDNEEILNKRIQEDKETFNESLEKIVDYTLENYSREQIDNLLKNFKIS